MINVQNAVSICGVQCSVCSMKCTGVCTGVGVGAVCIEYCAVPATFEALAIEIGFSNILLL